MKSVKRKYDIAYGSFGFAGAAYLLIGAAGYIPMDNGIAGGLGLLIFVPLSFASTIAILTGVGYSIVFFRRRQFIFLSALSVLFLFEIIADYGPRLLYEAAPFIYGVITFAFCYNWFFRRRKEFDENN